MMRVESDADSAMTEALDLLTEAGFAPVPGSPTQGTGLLGARQLTKDPYTVLLTVIPGDTADATTVQYVVEVPRVEP